MYRLADNILDALSKKGMTQMELAKELHLHENTVYGWTRGQRTMSGYALYRTSKILGISVEKLMEGVEDE